LYDGEGNRVKKITDQETTVFVYSSGKLIAEYSTAAPPQDPNGRAAAGSHNRIHNNGSFGFASNHHRRARAGEISPRLHAVW
jgi:hypothetical protein